LVGRGLLTIFLIISSEFSGMSSTERTNWYGSLRRKGEWIGSEMSSSWEFSGG
jgi:hypothetical protein